LLCASLVYAHKVNVDFDHGTHFSSYKTYSWANGVDAPWPDALFPNKLMQERIVAFIEEALAAKGLKRVPAGGQLLVRFEVQVQAHPEFITVSDGGPGWGWGGGISTTTVQTFYDGTLVVNLLDSKHQQMVFQGTSTQSISSKPQTNTKKLAKAVNEIFCKYPPQM
jgi:hypothetical protein